MVTFNSVFAQRLLANTRTLFNTPQRAPLSGRNLPQTLPAGEVSGLTIGDKKSRSDANKDSQPDLNLSNRSSRSASIASLTVEQAHWPNNSADRSGPSSVLTATSDYASPVHLLKYRLVPEQRPVALSESEPEAIPFAGFSRKQIDYRRLNEAKWLRTQGRFVSALKNQSRELSALSAAIGNLKSLISSVDPQVDREVEQMIDRLQQGVKEIPVKADTVSFDYFRKERPKEVAKGFSSGVYERTEAISFKQAYFEVKDLQKLSLSLIKLLKAKMEAIEQRSNLTRGPHTALYDSYERLKNKIVLIETVFDIKAKWYLAKASQADLNAHAIYQKMYALKPLQAAMSGSKIENSSAQEISGGAAVPTGPLVDVSVCGGLKATQSSAFTFGHDMTVNYMTKRGVGVNAEITASLTPVGGVKGSAGADRVYNGDYYQADADEKGLDDLATYAALQKNEERSLSRLLPASFLLDPSVQKAYSAMQKVKNKFRRVWGFDPKNPYMPIAITRDILAEGQGLRLLLSEAYKQLGVGERAVGSFDASKVLRLSLPAPASDRGTAKQTSAAFQITSLKAEAKAGFDTNVLSSGLLEGSLPSIEAKAGVAIERVGSKFNGVLLKPAHELMSMANTRSHEESLSLVEKITEKVWLAKSAQQVNQLPEHLRDIYTLISSFKPSAEISLSQAVRQIEQATAVIEKLALKFSEFEKLAPQFYTAAQRASSNNFHADRYNTFHQQLREHQLLGDRLPVGNRHNVEMAKEAVGRAWDSYSTALGAIEVTRVSQLLYNNPGVVEQPDIQQAMHNFKRHYQWLSNALANPAFPLLQNSLYRHSAVLANSDIEKTSKQVQLSASAALKAPALLQGSNPCLPENKNGDATYHVGAHPLFGVGGLSTHNWSKVTKMPNIFRQGEFETHSLEGQFISGANLLAPNKNGDSDPAVGTMPEVSQLITNALGLHDQEFNKTTTIARRNGEVQYIAYVASNIKSFSAATPNLLGVVGGKLAVRMSTSQTKTIAQNMMGSELAYHALQFPALAKYGVSPSAISDLKSIMVDDEAKQNKPLLSPLDNFFQNVEKDKQIQLTYFGLNGIGVLLDKFAEIDHNERVKKNRDGSFAFVGLDAFKKEISNKYFDRLYRSSYSAKKFISGGQVDTENDIFKEIGVTPAQVSALLKQTIAHSAVRASASETINTADLVTPRTTEATTAISISAALANQPVTATKVTSQSLPAAQTVATFLTSATPEQRAQFYKETEVGQKLFTAYVLLVNGANEIKQEFYNFPLSISEFAQKSPKEVAKSKGGFGFLSK